MAENLIVNKGLSKEETYKSLLPQINNLIEWDGDFIANIANIIAALKQSFGFFWIGVYFVKKESLVLGPFQGPVACTKIAMGKGVCGTSWQRKEVIVVDDVEQFPGHISCNADSKSEIVLPAMGKNGEVFLVLDIDSDRLSSFDSIDIKYLSDVIKMIERLGFHETSAIDPHI